MARRRTMNRKRYSIRRSIDSVGSGHLDPDTDLVDEEQTFWWNHLQENTPPPGSLIYNTNETARHLSVNSQVESNRGSSVGSEWWKNLTHSDSDHAASTSRRRNLSAEIVKTYVVQTSESPTSESEKEIDLRKRKVYLKASNNRKSINNAFSSALDDAENIPLKLRIQANNSDLRSDSAREVLQERLQDDEEDQEDNNLSLTRNILKSKPTISRRRRNDNTKDQNLFEDILTQDNVLNGSTARESIALEKESSKRLMHQSIDTSKNHIDSQRKSMRASQSVPLESIESNSTNLLNPDVENTVPENNEFVQSSDDSDEIVQSKYIKPKSRFMQRMRKSVARNAFADALADDADSSRSNLNKENDVHESSLTSRSSLNLSKISVTKSKSKIDIAQKNSSIHRSPRSSLNTAKNQSDLVQAKDNIEPNSSSSSLDDNELRRKKSVFLKPKSRKFLGNLRKSVTKNPYEEIFEEDSNISVRKSNVSTKDNHASFERDETAERISQARESLAIEKESYSKRSKTISAEDSYDDVSLTTSNGERDVSKKFHVTLENKSKNKLSENNDLMNASKSSSRKSTVMKTPEKGVSSSRKFIKEKTLEEHISTNETETREGISDDSRDDINIESDISTRVSKSGHEEETRLTRNSLRNRSETLMLVNEAIDNFLNDTNREQDSTVSKQSSKLVSDKEARLTRSLRNRSEMSTPTNLVQKIIDNSYNDANREQDLNTPKRVSKSSPEKEARLTRNSIRNQSETPIPANVVHKAINNSRNDANREDSGTPKQLFKSGLDKETRSLRNSLRNRSETPVHQAIDNSYNDASREQDLSTPKRVSKSSPEKEARLMHNNLRNRSETPVHQPFDNSYNNASKKQDSSMSKQVSKSSPDKETHLTRNSLRNRAETPKVRKDTKLSKRSRNWIIDSEEDDNVNADLEMNIDGISQIISSTRISKIGTNIETRQSTILSDEEETNSDKEVDSGMQTIQRNSTSTRAETSSKTVNQPSVQSSNRISIKEGKKTVDTQKSLGKFQNYRDTSNKKASKDISSNVSKPGSSKSLRRIDDFFKVKQTSTTTDKHAQESQIFNAEKMEKINAELERIKNREMAAMKLNTIDKKESTLKAKNVKSITLKQATKKKPLANPAKTVDKAFLVNGKVYRAPRLPRPKHWVTDRLYKFLWKCMEPKYKFSTRVKSEKFVQEFAKIVSLIERRKNYKNYNLELEALMKEMARLKIINTRNDFYHFCQDFMPYEFRVKVVPMLMPGNKMNIPYDPEKLHIPLLD